MAPPTQAGRFKPRKPAKRSAPTAVATPIAVPSTTTTTSTANAPAASPGRGGRDGRGSGGRGGRGRGGRGPVVMPQGQVFFTGTDKPAASSTRTSATAVAAAFSKRKGKAAGMIISSAAVAGGPKEVKSVALEVQEEIIMTNDDEGMDAVPDPAPRSAKLGSLAAREGSSGHDYESERASGGGGGHNEGPSDALANYYDSDSGEDEPMRDFRRESQLQPLLIDSAQMNQTTSNEATHLTVSDENQTVSPLLVQSDSAASRHSPNNNNKSLFLVQLPTRLPPIISATRPDEVPKDGGVGTSLDAGDEDPVPVSTPAVEVGSFDNQLTDANPGRMGKIVVYKSGRTVFVWESAPGEPVVKMNVSEGLNCNFRQQAALIDTGNNEFTPLGIVQKTIVVTPELGDGHLI